MKKSASKYSFTVILVLFVIITALLCVTGVAFAEDGEQSEAVTVDNGIPVIYINIDESRGSIEDMMESPDHNDYCYGTIDIDVPENFHYSDFPDVDLTSIKGLEMSIRGRGNSTWTRADKKPFKIKLENKTDLFGLGKNKHWVLVANALDPSLLKDRVTAWLADQMDFGFTPRGVPVDLVMTGQEFGSKYLGSYYFSENVRVDDNRLEIQELEETDTELPKISGGYLIQNSAQVRIGSPDKFETSRGVGWATHTPSFDPEDQVTGPTLSETEGGTEAEDAFNDRDSDEKYQNLLQTEGLHPQQEYIQKYIQDFEDILFDGSTKYRDLMDVESTAKYWLINSVSLNHDAYRTGSTYLYKDRDPEDGSVAKLYWGPVWDFDFAWYYDLSYSGFTTEGKTLEHQWLYPLFCDKSEGGFVQELHDQWPAMKDALKQLSEDGGIIDQYYEETKKSAKEDFIVNNPDIDPKDVDQYFDYRAITEQFKAWINNRVDWVDENFNDLDNFVHEVNYYADGQLFFSSFIIDGREIEGPEDIPEKEGYVFLGWVDENGNEVNPRTEVFEDMIITAKFVSEDEAIMADDIVFKKNNDLARFFPFAHAYQIQYTILPTDAQERSVTWTSSDEELATVSNDGVITFNQPDEEDYEVTITATLKNGRTRDFTLQVTSGDMVYPESISPEEEVIAMNMERQKALSIVTEPSTSKIDEYIYSSDDENVVTIDENGVLTAVAPGTATVHVTAICYAEEEIRLEAAATVYVSELPLVEMYIDESQGTIEDMNNSPDHVDHCYGTMRIDVPEGFTYSDTPDGTKVESLDEIGLDIRGRGNTSWLADKKPYKIKLDKKTKVLGMKKNKHWVLLANAFDKTLIKDRITAWLGNQLGFDFTPTGYPVELVMNGKYLGSYYLSENVRVDDNRIEIDELTEKDIDPLTITGGYLLQHPLQTRDGSPDRFITTHGCEWATHTPTFDVGYDDDAYENAEQQKYIQGFMQDIEDALYGENFTNDKGQHYLDLMDVDSAAKYWLMNEIALNGDAYGTGSTYVYKPRDVDENTISKLYWGPLWDFDYAWYYESEYDVIRLAGQWTPAMMYDTNPGGFVDTIKKWWSVMKPALTDLAKDGGVIDKYYEETRASAEIDKVVNPEDQGAIYDGEEFNYLKAIKSLKSWILHRTLWFDDNISMLDNYIHKTRYFVDGELYSSDYTIHGQTPAGAYDHPVIEGQVFSYWTDENGDRIDLEMPVTEDMDFYAVYIPEDEATHGQDIALRTTSDMAVFYENAYNYYHLDFMVLPTDAQDTNVEWTSSDESIATIENSGRVDIYAPGTVTFTGTLKYGKTRTFTLIITDGEPVYPEAMYPETDTVYLMEGEESPLTFITDPSPAIIGPMTLMSDDWYVVEPDYSGFIIARGSGMTQINAIMDIMNDQWDLINSLHSSVTVIVSPDEETENANRLIHELPDELKAADESKVKAARKAYEALDEYQKSCVSTILLAQLDLSEAKVATAIAEEELAKAKADKEEAEKKLAEAQAAQKKAELALKKAQAKNRTVSGLKVTSKNRRIIIKYKKNSKATGYQIQYKLKSAKKYKYLTKGTKKTKYTTKKFKKGKVYKVRVRTYNKIDGKKYYGRWSKVKTVKIKN